jgi:hypothetical protein
MRLERSFCFFTLCFITVNAFSQAPVTHSGIKVTLELYKGPSKYFGLFDQGMPFEKPFSLHVNMAAGDTGVVAAQFSYEIEKTGFLCSTNPTSSLILPAFCSDAPQVTEFSNKGFNVEIRGIHPNKKYKFNFTFYYRLTDVTKKSLKNDFANAIDDFLKDPKNDFGPASITNVFTSKITSVLNKQFPNGVFKDSIGNSLQFKDLISRLLTSPVIPSAYNAKLEYAKKDTELKKYVDSIVNVMTSPGFKSLLSDINFKFQFQDFGKPFYDNSLIDTGRFKYVPVKLLTPLIVGLCSKQDLLFELLNGNFAYDDGIFVPSNNLTDMGFVNILYRYLIQVNRHLNYITGIQPSAAQRELVIKSLGFLKDYIFDFEVNNYSNLEKEVDKDYLREVIPDDLVNLFVADRVTLVESTELDDITTNNSAYISLDLGLGYTEGLSSLFTYYGVNFYFVPIDKTIHLNTYNPRPWLRVLKSTSLTLGVITNYFNSGNPSKRYSSLLGGGKDVFTGIGNRVSRVIKFNAGIDWSYLNDPNPLSNKRKLNGKFAVTMSVDVNIIKAFSALANALGLTN